MITPDDLLPVGLEDALPDRARAITMAMRAVLDAMDGHGYDRVRPPLVEFERSLAGRMDGVATRRMVRFTDPDSLRTLALRSDMTVQVGRIAATGMASAPRPLRLCYAGDVAFLSADQLDPARQRLQMGAELIGADSVAAASEIVSVAIDALKAAGVANISVDFTLPDLVDTLADKAMPLGPAEREAVRRELDTKDAGGLREAGGDAYLPLLYATGDFDEAIDKLAAIDAGGALASRIEGLHAIAAAIGDGARVTLDPTERHGFEYQSWFGFTLYGEGARGALGRGGTYMIKGSDEAATGFSLYIDPLLDALGSTDDREAQKLFLPPGHDRDTAARLRAIGWRTVAAVAESDDARALGCSHVLEGKEPRAL
ncbi:ATP phosphoribosyltransferase regulatory subunit [Erythrobacter sp.]|uniref:ATP phosphoribosyltransferase regulatory subunit n=1 Tax=Erythrobacter sp. TaxID=1042 RepID=UPI001B15491B|nr:ATP phosphoribosyltransferase regulatory subunit [Erythrobacter sp.]MBO6525804.1 ATP phosphoribosyltransferase regulatory subunit [Erythrobacter sp.]MBO6529521.1 ATP phosphoribosyltransferase regulatory subunit [Erythrobacter sp.]